MKRAHNISILLGGAAIITAAIALMPCKLKADSSPSFTIQTSAADIARWMYPFNSNPAGRPTASVFGSLGSNPDFDSRDAQILLGWTTTNRVPAGIGQRNYLIRHARITLTIASGDQYAYTGTLRDYRTYFPKDDPRYIAPAIVSCPIELFGAGFRGGYTNAEGAFIPYAATNYPQDGPWAVDPSAGFYTNRAAFAAGFNTNGVLVDVSNNAGDNGTNEIPHPFEVSPFAVGQSTNVIEGQLMPLDSQLSFNLNLDDPLIYGYLQRGLNEGRLSFVVASFVSASLSGPPNYPNFYTIFSPLAAPEQVPVLDLEGSIVRPDVDTDADGLPDDWEMFYFGSLTNDAADDLDGDGAGNLAECNAGTIPTDASSVLQLISVRHEAGISEVHFTTAPSRLYDIRSSADLQSWQITTNPPLFYSSCWLAKTGTNAGYPAPIYAVWRDTNAFAPIRLYQPGAH